MRRRQLIAMLSSTALVSTAEAAPPDTCGMPVAGSDGWPVAAADDGGPIDRAALCRATDPLARAASVNVHSVIVAQNGTLTFERYFNGPDEVQSRHVRFVTFDADSLHDMKSVSKSVASLAIGIAVDRGMIPGLDTPVFDFFPELADLRTPEKDRIRLSHLLTMSLGLRWIEAGPDTEGANDEDRMNRTADPCRYVLGLPVTAPAGQSFFYNTGALRVLSAIVRKATGQPLDDFTRTVLFEPLGITRFEWRRVKGDTDAGGGLRLRPRDMLKIGQLVANRGRWHDKQIVPQAWIDASTTPHLKATDGFSYGYLWWMGQTRLDDRTIRWIAAFGRGGQSIRIVPDRNLVVAVTAGYYQDYSPQAFRVLNGVFRDVLKAIAVG